MKFLCVACDEQMKLKRTIGPERGSITLIYGCPTCGYAFAMMTNPHETQVVSSLGVKVGVQDGATAAAASKCPVTGMLQGLEREGEAEDAPMWTPAARERLAAIPEMVRPMAASGIESFAKQNGYVEIDEKVLEEARAQFGF